MYLRRTTLVALAAVAAGCSGGVGSEGGKDGWGGQESDSTGDSVGGGDTSSNPAPAVVDNGDGTTTITNPDGSQVTVDEEGNVVATTPAPTTPGTTTPQNPSVPSVAGACTPGTPQTTQVPRLSNLQYDNTVKDLLGVDLGLGPSTLATESKGNMDSATWKGFQAAAVTLSATVLTNATARSKVITCTTEDKACATQVITEFGAKAFRRPLAAAEVTKFEALFDDTALTATGSFDEQIGVVLEAMFQSPYFLTIAEISETPVEDVSGGQRFALSGHEVAARLSYMLWNTMPDAPLMAAADAGTLVTSTGIAEQVERMLADPRAAHLVEQLHTSYMRMGPGSRWENYTRDATAFPLYSPAQAPLLTSETLRFAQDVFDSGGTFEDLMTSTKGFVSSATAPLYGLESSGFGQDLVATDLGPTRPGILTRAGFLATNAYGNRTSPIHRGAFIEKYVLCTPIGDPDPAAAATPLPERDGLVTNRQKTDAQTEAEAGGCKACHHGIINPAGFALEGFDAVGGVQTMDNGVPVDTQADVVIDGVPVPVTGAVDLMNAIAASPGAHACYSKKWVEVAYNRVISSQDACTINDIASRMATDGYSVKQLVSDLTTIESFRFRALEN